MRLKRKVDLTFTKKINGVRMKSRLGICKKKVGFSYRDTKTNHEIQMKISFDFHEEKLWGWNEK